MKTNFLHFVTSVTFLLLPAINFAQYIQPIPPNLGAAGSFALFTNVGAHDHIGSETFVTGDVGTNSGAFTAFTPGTLVGFQQVENTASAAASASVTSSYTYLQSAAVPCDTVIGPVLGSGQVLKPYVYCINGASSLNGDLFLDGQGDPSSIFIFKIDGAITTASLSRIRLINSTQWYNVWFQVNGAVNIGVSSQVRGTVIANGAIKLFSDATLTGRGLSVAGEIALLNNNIVTMNQNVLLPVTLLNFTATTQGSSALLKWSTATEQNSKSFVIERSNSAQASTWTTISTLAAAGNSTSARQYSVVDNNVNKGMNYYRLRIINMDGSYTISKVELLNFDATPMLIKIFPNPVKNMLTVTGIQQGSTLMLVDMAGKTLNQQRSSGSGTDLMETSQLASGTYLLKIAFANGKITTLKVNKQ